ncbi:hypothetical protein FQN55_005857 [Onygenales sp. PD_40]|nr:hypothetical protein FQN55_005857 [Onygenales sp. PD_40]KAK2773073.1 hypothetical protein FQN52_004721 [Onygenales sp. PD_12]KAK2781018.1 hypothetical protein FQN53_000871 [Emmonsiellopsis sp. PD_33]KAK2787519.1 hypothetical protein FQN51_003150 [Onygenales sp. PD_10]
MIPELPGIRMLDTEALTDLLHDNLSPPEITSIMFVPPLNTHWRSSIDHYLTGHVPLSCASIFATNGAIFAHASSLPARQLRNLSASYGAAYSSYAVNAPSNHPPSSYVTALSEPQDGDGSIVFECDNLAAVVTQIADRVLLAVIGPSHVVRQQRSSASDTDLRAGTGSAASDTERAGGPGYLPAAPGSLGANPSMSLASSAPNPSSTLDPHKSSPAEAPPALGTDPDTASRLLWDTERNDDMERIGNMNLQVPSAVLLALESKSGALGKFLRNNLQGLEYPDDF